MKQHIFAFSLFIFYLIGMTIVMIWQGIGIAPDRYALVLLLGSLLIKRTRGFLLDWIPFLFILISYDFLRGLAPKLTTNVNYLQLIQADEFIFKTLPTITLQNLFFSTQQPAWYDYFATIIYFLHFALPLSFGFLLWIYNKPFFRQFTAGILILSYAALITFIIFPAAPPWWASNNGYIPPITKILDVTLAAFPDRLSLPTIYHQFNPNPVAAMPSLHAAYPFLIFLFAIQFFKIKGLFFLPYVLAVWLSIVYLGEHYVVDVFAGAIFALAAFIVTIFFSRYINWRDLLKKLPFSKPH